MWDVIETDFGDETANFGPRKESGTALYQIDTIATVSCREEDNKVYPNAVSSVLGDLTCLAIDTSLIVQSSSLLGFDHVIDEIEWSPDGSLIIVGVSSGHLHILSAESTEIIFSVNLVPEERKVNRKAFRKILFAGASDLVILTADGQLIVQRDVEIFKQEGGDTGEAVKDKITMCSTKEAHTAVNDMVINGDFIYTMGQGESIISKWNFSGAKIELVDLQPSILADDSELIMASGTSDGQYLFTLDTNYHISVWDADILVCVKKFDDMEVGDICLLETSMSRNKSLEGMKCVVMTRPLDGVCYLKVQSLPSWETVYSLQLAAPSYLAQCNTMQDAIYITEFCENTEKPGTITTVRFRCLNETDPKARLYRILQKNKFEEAEKFANLFQLDIELVHKVKANYLVDQLSPWNAARYSETELTQMIEQLFSCLDTIVDDLHAAENCMKAALPSFTDTEALLSYCQKRLDNAANSKNQVVREKHQLFKGKMLEIQQRLVTYRLAYGEDNFSGEKWEAFMRTSLLQEALQCLDRGQVDTAFIIWARHQAEWTSNILTIYLVHKILSVIPHKARPAELLGYLSTALIPTVMREIPQALESIVTYVMDKAKLMETTDKPHWPSSAIQFCDFIYHRLLDVTTVVIDEETCMANDNANKTKMKSDTVLQPLLNLLLTLKQLDEVIHKYKCQLSLEQFMQETKETIVFRMLDKVVSLELIVPTLERQIRPYMKEYELHQDQIFSQYIKDLLERYGQMRCYTGQVPWETKAAAVIDCITDVEQKIEGILEVMKWASIPWSSEVEQLVQMGLKLKHNKVSKLRHQCDRVHVKKVMMKYGLKNAEAPQGPEAERLMYMMLTMDQDGCMEDALHVMDLCKVQGVKPSLYYFRMCQLIVSDRIEDCLELLRSLPIEVGLKTGLDIVTLTFVKLNTMVEIGGIEEQIHRERRLYTEAAIHVNKYLMGIIRDPVELQDMADQNTLLANLLSLQVEFGLYVSANKYSDEDYRLEVIFNYIKECFVKANQSPASGYAKVYRLATLLQISHTTIQGQMAIKLANAGDINRAVQLCGELYESSPSDETANTLYEVAKAFLVLMAEVNTEDVDTNKLRLLPDVCHRLACQAVYIGAPDKIGQYLELSKTCSLLQSVSQQCELGDKTLSEEWGEAAEFCLNKDRELMVDFDLFEVDALIMNSVVVLPLVSTYALLNPLLDVPREEPDTSEGTEEVSKVKGLCQGVLPVVQHLRDNRHIHLAFDFSQHMLNTLNPYIQQQDMGLPFFSESQQERVKKDQESEQTIIKSSQALLKDLNFNIVMKVFNSSKADVLLAFTFLSTRPNNEVVDIMMRLVKMAGQQYKKLQQIAGMGIALGQTLQHLDLVSKCQLLEVNASWGYRLSKLKIAFKDAFMGPKSEKKKLLPVIAQNDRADTDLVKDFCQAFQLDEDEGLLLYLDHLFAPHEEIIPESQGNKAALIERAREAICEIKNSDDLQVQMEKIYYRVSPYDYEILVFLLEVMKMKREDDGKIPVEKGLQLLDYLRNYTRHSQPSEYEVGYKDGGEKKESHIFIATLPPESKSRLPFHPMLHGDPWKIITSELKRENLSTWLLIAKLLNLSPDQICLTAVQNMVFVYTEMFTSPDAGSDMSQWNWRPEQANHALLQDASQVLKNIKNCENSLVCSKWMVNKLPLGSEKVIVLENCIKIAELWHLSINEDCGKKEKAKAVFVKFLAHWQKMATAQALCLHGLGEAELLQITDKPRQLIQKLYEHPSITQSQWGTGAVKPDVHGAAVKIAEVNKISLDQIQTELMEKWLQASSGLQQESDTTMTFNLEKLKFTDTPTEQENDEETNFQRVVHLMQKGTKGTNIYLLLSFAFKPKEGQDTITCIRALRCLLYLCEEDDEDLKTRWNKSLDDIRNLLHIMIYLASLDKLHIHHTVETFQACQKDGLIKGIWKNHSHEKTAVTLVSCLCLDYKLYDVQLWNNLLQRLQSFGLMRQLEYVLLRLNKVSKLWQISAFSKVWHAVVAFPLQKVCPPLSKEQTDMCVHYFNILLSCPVVKEVELEKLARMYQKLQLHACALGCLVLGQNPADTAVQTFLGQNVCKELLDSIECLQMNGLNHGVALQLEETVYKEVLRTGQFEQVMDTVHQKPFIAHCIQNRMLDQPLVFAIKGHRIKEAKAVFMMYSAAHPDILLKLNKYVDEEEEEEDSNLVMLKAYLKMQNLTEATALM